MSHGDINLVICSWKLTWCHLKQQAVKMSHKLTCEPSLSRSSLRPDKMSENSTKMLCSLCFAPEIQMIREKIQNCEGATEVGVTFIQSRSRLEHMKPVSLIHQFACQVSK